MTNGPTRLLLVRHGESICGVTGIAGGEKGCTGLTERGHRQAAALAARLEQTGEATPAIVYASSLPRAIETAEAVAPAVGAAGVKIDPDLVEMIPGEIDGSPWEHFRTKYEPFEPTLHPKRPLTPGGDSWHSFRTRVARVVKRLVRDHEGETVIAVCHGGPVMASVIVNFRIPRPGSRANMTPDFTSITEWTHTDGIWNLVRYNDRSHTVGL